MTPTQQLQSLLHQTYTTPSGDEYKIELLPGLTNEEINTLAQRLPTKQIPDDIRDLLLFTRGFEFYGIEEIRFDGIGQFGFENIFPYSAELAGDGFGNFWILDINAKGQWGNVFYVCHDPAVVVKHSDDLSQFIQHVHEYGSDMENSNMHIIHEKNAFDIWKNNHGFIEISEASNSSDTILKDFAASVPENFVIADLRNKSNGSGFAWGRFGPAIDKAVRHNDELLWAVEKKVKKGFFARLFG